MLETEFTLDPPQLERARELYEQFSALGYDTDLGPLNEVAKDLLMDLQEAFGFVLDYVEHLEVTNARLYKKLGILRDIIEEVCGATTHKRKAG